MCDLQKIEAEQKKKSFEIIFSMAWKYCIYFTLFTDDKTLFVNGNL